MRDHSNWTGAEQAPSLLFAPYDDPDPTTLPRRSPDHFLRKCARIAALQGETFGECKAAWEGRRDEAWWRIQYRERPEPDFTEADLALAYAEAVAARVEEIEAAFA